MPHEIAALSEHYVICGYGRVGHEVAAGLLRRKRGVVAIDHDPPAPGTPDAIHIVHGDATDDGVLLAAGVRRAHGLVAGTGSDATNLVIVLSARALNSGLLIVARANQRESEPKLLRAGASRVVSPYAIGAHRIATQLVSPGIVEFLDAIRDGEHADLWIKEVAIAGNSPVVGQRLGAELPRTTGLPNVVAIRGSTDRRLVTNPSPDLRLAAGDTLIVVGSRAQLQQVIARATPQPAAPSVT
jgi:voltage-gated potassium channel